VFTGHESRLRRIVSAGLLALALGGCVTDPTAQDSAALRPEAVILPPVPPRTTALDALANREHARLVAAFGGEYKAPQTQALLNQILTRLGSATERPSERYSVTLLNSPVVNAFALPNGNIYLTRGLLVLANDTSEIASVLAHEMSHVITRHAVDRQELARTADLVTRVRSDVLQDPGAARALSAEGRVALASFSRQQELEADALSVRIIARAGFDPYGATRFLDALGRTTAIRAAMMGLNSSNQSLDITSTHPAAPERIQLATLAARQIGAPGMGEAERNRYLLAINGMTVADSAAQGYVRGAVFSHPKLGVTFTAPEGFVLENSRDAVVGVAPDAGRAMRFDQAKLDPGQSLENYMQSGLIQGSEATNIEALTLGGLPAATSLSKADGWTYRIFAVRVGAQVFRLTYAARNMDGATDAAYRRSAESFRKLEPGEGARLRPLRISLTVANSDDTVETLAARMVMDEPRAERFRVLNGLQASERVFAGQRYKLVTE
jgi:predicted Zn-dependent protease